MATNSQMELWNTSRKASSKIIHAVKNENSEQFNTIEQEYGTVPFDSYDDAKVLVEAVSPVVDTDMELLDAVHKWVYEQYKQTGTTPDMGEKATTESSDTEDETSDELSDLEAWNKARSAVSSLLTWVENGSSAESYSDIQDEHSFLPSSLETAETFVALLSSEVSGEEIDKHNHISRSLKQVLLGNQTFEDLISEREDDEKPKEREETSDGDVSNSEGMVSVEDVISGSDEKTRIVEGLYDCFVEHDMNYRDLLDEVDAELPPRDVSLMNVINTKGKTKEERLQAINSWVDAWYQNPGVLEELRETRNHPMGKRQNA